MICSDCHEEKPLSEYYLNVSGSPQRRCKACNVAKKEAWRQEKRAGLGRHEGWSPEAHRFTTMRIT